MASKLAPWQISRVELNSNTQRVDLSAEHDDTRWPCPDCDQPLACGDHAEERTWRHLDTCQFQTHVRARVLRVQCPPHGVKQVRIPWAELRGRFTLLMERLVIDVIRQCSTLTGACRILQITCDEAWGVMARAVARGQTRKRPRRSATAWMRKRFAKATSTTRSCAIWNARPWNMSGKPWRAEFGAVLRRADAAATGRAAGGGEDMWDPYIKATRLGLPDGAGRIVFDRFHVMRDITTAVDVVRKHEHRTLLRETGESVLTGTKYVWLYAAERLPGAWRASFKALRTLWTYRQPAAAARFFRQWYGGARRSQLEPIKRVAATLQRHLPGVLRYCRHRITNGVAEGVTSKIMTIKRKACGFRNAQHFTTAIYFHCGGLDLYPR